jgi:DNA-binding response OmpR family regulator
MPRVLVIDDADDVRHVIRSVLEEAGHEVTEAENGREGLRVLYDLRPDLVLLDVAMPDMDGWTALERIRELTWVPILMLTGRDATQDRVRGLRSGADDYIAKPFNRQELLARIDVALRRASAGEPREHRQQSKSRLLRDETRLDPW